MAALQFYKLELYLVLENCKFSGCLNLQPGSSEPRDRRHVEAGDDAHQRVEVRQVDALPGNFRPELDHLHSHFLLLLLQKQKMARFVNMKVNFALKNDAG